MKRTPLAELDKLSDEIAPLKAALGDLEGLADGFGRAMTTAFRRSVIDGKRLEVVLKSLALGLSGRALNAALAPLERGLSGLLAGLFGGLFKGIGFAKGGVIGTGVTPLSAGGIVRAPTLFPMRGGAGLMGEAGPEAILPLARGADGKLGVRGGGAGQVNVTFNVTTPDAASFRRAEAELTAMLARAVAHGQRGL
jgi:phage-related minor tail protein